jgi:hypothetical protein
VLSSIELESKGRETVFPHPVKACQQLEAQGSDRQDPAPLVLGNNSHESTRPATSLKPGTLRLEQITVRLREADAALGLVALLREDLAGEIRRRRLSRTGDHAAATEVTQGAAPFVVMMSRLVAVVTSLATPGRQHWGRCDRRRSDLVETFAV